MKRCSRCIVVLSLATIIMMMSFAGCSRPEPAAGGPKLFATPEDAGKSLYDAAKSGDTNALLATFGPDAKDLLLSGDPVQDKAALDNFAAAYDQMHRWENLKNGVALDLGAENYPFPFPLLKNQAGQWYFDSNSAKQEIIARRIGQNELDTISTLSEMAAAQADYYSQTHDGAKVKQYAQKFVSDEGKQNGLYWAATCNQPESPLGPLAGAASAEGYFKSPQAPQPFHGYFFRILTKQGDKAPGGAKDYVVNGNMRGGFAILAYPAEYRNSGVMSFVINRDGVILQSDLGANTADGAKAITAFNPDDSWQVVE
jgi:hypothetical protein